MSSFLGAASEMRFFVAEESRPTQRRPLNTIVVAALVFYCGGKRQLDDSNIGQKAGSLSLVLEVQWGDGKIEVVFCVIPLGCGCWLRGHRYSS